MLLRREMSMRILEVVEDFKPGRMGQSLEYLAFVHGVHRMNIE
jgi:hypothetical protein